MGFADVQDFSFFGSHCYQLISTSTLEIVDEFNHVVTSELSGSADLHTPEVTLFHLFVERGSAYAQYFACFYR